MSSTRLAAPGSEFRPERHASSPEYVQGLPAQAIARRCEHLASDAERDLVWGLQSASWAVGMDGTAQELLAMFGDRLGTATMRRLGCDSARNYTADEIRTVRDELESQWRADKEIFGLVFSAWPQHGFLLRGERNQYEQTMIDIAQSPARREWDGDERAEVKKLEELQERSDARPESYPAQDFLKVCQAAAAQRLARWLQEFCTDPRMTFAQGGPAYFQEVLECLQVWSNYRREKAARGRYVTASGRRIREAMHALAACPQSSNGFRPITFIKGGPGSGKTDEVSALAREWPGRVRYFAVPSGNDDLTFFQAVGKALGVPGNRNTKLQDLRFRVTTVLERWHGILILDEAHRLWPASDLKNTTPRRIEWVNEMADLGARICLVGGPQYFASQALTEARTRRDTLQDERRIGNVVEMAARASLDDIEGIARALLPEASEAALETIATMVDLSTSPLSVLSNIRCSAQSAATAAGRPAPSDDDIRAATKRAIASDEAMKSAYQGKAIDRTSSAAAAKRSAARSRTPREGTATGSRESSARPASPASPARAAEIFSATSGRQTTPSAESEHSAPGVAEHNRLTTLEPA